MVPGILVQATRLPLMCPSTAPAVPHAGFMQGCFLQAGLKKSYTFIELPLQGYQGHSL